MNKTFYRWIISFVVLMLAACSATPTSAPPAAPAAPPIVPSATQVSLPPVTSTPSPIPTQAPTNIPSIAVPSATPTSATPTLGSTKVSDKDKMVEIYIPGGEFTMGAVNDPDARQVIDHEHSFPEVPSFKFTLDSYWIDKFDVTNSQWALCVAAGACKPPKTGLFSLPNYASDPKYANYPVVSITWFMATDYCKWAGRRLLTEAEWEKAARGTDARKYPWGNDPVTSKRANFCDVHCPRTIANSNFNDGYPEMSPVGSFPDGASPFGVMDMAGDVWNWTSTLIRNYPYNPTDGREDQNAPGERVWRGGTWSDGTWWLRSSLRYHSPPTYYITNLGLRCGSSN